MDIKSILILAPAFAFLTSAFAQQLPEGDAALLWNDVDHEWYNKQRIYDNDLDTDNMLSREEVLFGEAALTYFRQEAHFADADRLSDGKLSVDELRTFNQHETRWLVEFQMRLLDSLMVLYPGLKEPTKEWVESDPTGFQQALTNAYWMNHHADFVKGYITDAAWLTAHVKETKLLLSNKFWLTQHPELASQIYPLTEATWKRDAVLSRWIRKHSLYISEYRG